MLAEGLAMETGKSGESAGKSQEAIVKAKVDFARALGEDLVPVLAALPGDWSARIKPNFESKGPAGPNLWEAANLLGACFNAHTLSDGVRSACVEAITRIRDFQGRLARESGVTTTVVFGTSGWREAIGEGFTVENVHKVARGII